MIISCNDDLCRYANSSALRSFFDLADFFDKLLTNTHNLFHETHFRRVENGRVAVGNITGLVDYAKVLVGNITGLVDYAKVLIGSPRFDVGTGRFAVECITGDVGYGKVIVESRLLNIFCAFIKDRTAISLFDGPRRAPVFNC